MTFLIRDRGKDKEEPAEPQYDLTEEQEAELEDRAAEIERGEWVDGDWVQQELRRRRGLVLRGGAGIATRRPMRSMRTPTPPST